MKNNLQEIVKVSKFYLTILISIILMTSCAFVQNTDSNEINIVNNESNIHIQSSIVNFEDTHKTAYDGSDFYTYFYGETIGTKDTIVGLAIIEPNNEIHPPHQHAEEEYLYIVEGSGIWTLNGVETPAKTGDVLYVSPWDLHGIFNTGDVPMKFFITRASNKGVIVEPSLQVKE
ncbi:cupin domain-containing protein [Shewanella electrodiphila]|uniref:Cupin domain-containing protein n=1 Tax=Shewanella electrodiphila TaxID=934143 RepID=A0ABT0KNC0_9GAMM|nr:cupin domain-containing protein [Shewanella electrodiphila]MCL1045026.1 cupin domain-containing protein [Shewanella electrodiphila]